MEKEKKLWEVLVPRYSNSKKEYPIKYHRVWDVKVRKIAGGITIFMPAKGQWISPKRNIFSEEMIPVRIYCGEKEINKIISLTLKYYNQEAIFAYEISSNVKIKYKK